MRNLERLREGCSLAVGGGFDRVGCDGRTVCVINGCRDVHKPGYGSAGGKGAGRTVVAYGGLHADVGRVLRCVQRGDECAVAIDVNGIGGRQVDVAIDAGAGIPAGVGEFVMIDADGQDVVAGGVQPGVEGVFERGKSVRPGSEFVAVEIDGGVVVDAVEAEGDGFAAVGVGNGKVFSIPADAGGEEGGAAGPLLVELAFDGVVMREIETSPGGVVECGVLRIGRIAGGEAPVLREERLLRVAGGGELVVGDGNGSAAAEQGGEAQEHAAGPLGELGHGVWRCVVRNKKSSRTVEQ